MGQGGTFGGWQGYPEGSFLTFRTVSEEVLLEVRIAPVLVEEGIRGLVLL